eukprot:evm.model.NODE_27169_length_92994_cov_27.080458.31
MLPRIARRIRLLKPITSSSSSSSSASPQQRPNASASSAFLLLPSSSSLKHHQHFNQHQHQQIRGLADLGKGVDILAPGEEETGKDRTFLLGYDGGGFEVRDINYRGSILAMPSACFLWKPRKVEEITPESLAALMVVRPPIEILVVGSGEDFVGRPLAPATLAFLAANGVAVEHMDTTSACSTFNILNQEDRRVAAALLAVDAAAEENEG